MERQIMVMVRLDHVTTRYDASHYPPRRNLSPWAGEEASDVVIPSALSGARPDSGRGQTQVYAKTILDDLSLTVLPGETLSVIGPSGCGKSTLLRVIAGLIDPIAGGVYFDGRPMNGLPPRERQIGMVFQNYALYPHMVAQDNLGFFWRLRRRRKPEISERVRQTAQVLGVGFDKLLGRLPRQLSGGEQQRVAVGRCIIREPAVFLLDEPFSNLDAHLRERSRREVKKLLRMFAVTTVFVTHDQHEAMAMGDRIAVMRSGKIVQVGTFQELYEDPHDSFVAGFFGDPPIGLLPCRYHAEAERLEDGAGIALSLAGASRILDDGQDILLGVRPEHVCLTAPEEEGAVQGRVSHFEPRLADRAKIVYFDIASQRAAAKVPYDTPIRVGEPIAVRFHPAGLLLFDARSHRRLYAASPR
ncbi:MAG TPA: ABC transporter ATP-binding protein [Alphaproteobacteria bacterium]|nr:ABC transporter ATP-binding protein [Alphaproteobacteria bacterium]